MNPLKEKPGEKMLALRKKLNMTQAAFWSRVGVSQPCGSRFEQGRPVPRQTSALVDIVYGKAPIARLAELRGVPVIKLMAEELSR